jgi:Concanavalin A-like lectin/glucanases superfamily
MGFIYQNLFVDGIPALKALNSTSTPTRVDGVFLGVKDNGEGFPGWYRYFASTSAVEDLPSIVASSDGIGAWFSFSGASNDSGIEIGTTTTGSPGTDASVTATTIPTGIRLDFTIPRGSPGAAGQAASINLDPTTVLNPDQPPSVANTGSSSAAIFNFSLPRSPTFNVGTVSSLAAGSPATVSNTGSNGDIVLDFGIPQGSPGTVSATTALILTPTSTPPTTQTNQVALFIDATDSNKLKRREPNNGMISEIGSSLGGNTGGDTYFNNVSLLMHFDGADNSTTFTDVKGHTINRFGNTVISTAQFKFGGSAGYFDGSGDYLSIMLDDSLTFGAGDFTWECWAYLLSSGSNMAIIGNAAGGSSGNAGLFLTTLSNRFVFRHWINGNTNATSSQTISLNTWYHLAVIKTGTTLDIYVDGIKGTSGSTFSTTQDNNFNIGTVPNNSGFATDFQGYIDEVRLTKGVARYAANFTSPIAAFPDD